MHLPGLYIAHSPKRGRGVFSAQDIHPQDVIEICPLIFIPKNQLSRIHHSILHDYYFLWPGNEEAACIALGYGSLYNHSFEPGAEVIFDLPEQKIVIRCILPIQAGTEIFIDYSGGIKQYREMWFEVA